MIFPEKLYKIRIVGLISKRKEILKYFSDLKCVDIREIDGKKIQWLDNFNNSMSLILELNLFGKNTKIDKLFNANILDKLLEIKNIREENSIIEKEIKKFESFPKEIKIEHLMHLNVKFEFKSEGKVKDYLNLLNNKLIENSLKEKDIKSSINDVLPSKRTIKNFLIENSIFNALNKGDVRRTFFILEAWIPANKIDKLNNTNLPIAFEILPDQDNAPTLTNHRIKSIEKLIAFYGLPKSNEVDPTIFIYFIFPVLSGLMIGDIGYGLSIAIIALIIYKKPNYLAMFAKNNTIKTIAKWLLISGISGIIFGALLGYAFAYKLYPGFSLSYIEIIEITVILGVLIVALGIVLALINNIVNRNTKRIAAESIKLGIITVAVIAILLKITSLLYLEIALILGLILISRIEGIEVISLVSHTLSFIRIASILLVGLILGEIINNFVHFIPLQIILQLLNVFLIAFEANIQAVRLIYVEFFSKFYSGEGTEFKPFKLKSNLRYYL